ncbi:hypothetical protein [Bacillus sp. FJAT-42315]|uniref:hypothetical protein n=1 Tax=Bacillus sp. FJAT-42315 TaxID=2014077 RepID=UPI000C236695|nr:hypothetical protein [Bacillus sp. FJAT-42315]
MKKYYMKALIMSAFAGLLIRGIALIILGQPILTNPENYIASVLIAMASFSISFFIHVKVLTNTDYPFSIKLGLTYFFILLIYFSVNVFFGGLSILSELTVYLFALMIMIISLPLIYHFNKKIMMYNHYLHLKKSKNANKTFLS